MSQPVKVSDEVYAELKRRAAENSSTLQEALAAVLRQAASDIREMRKELAAVKRTANAHTARLEKMGDALDELRGELAAVREEATASHRDLVEAHNNWTDTWDLIPSHAEALRVLRARVATLERTAHRHIGQRRSAKVSS